MPTAGILVFDNLFTVIIHDSGNDLIDVIIVVSEFGCLEQFFPQRFMALEVLLQCFEQFGHCDLFLFEHQFFDCRQ